MSNSTKRLPPRGKKRRQEKPEPSEGEKWLEQNKQMIRDSDRLVKKISRELSFSASGNYTITQADLVDMTVLESAMFSWVMKVLSLTYTDRDWSVEEDPAVGTYTISWTQR